MAIVQNYTIIFGGIEFSSWFLCNLGLTYVTIFNLPIILFCCVTEDAIKNLRSELQDADARRAELETRVRILEQDKERLELEKLQQEEKAKEVRKYMMTQLCAIWFGCKDFF